MSTLDEVIAVLRDNQVELRRRGVLHAGVFGSVARGDDRPDSDVDVLVELDPKAGLSLLGYVGIGNYLEDLLNRRVDLANRKMLKPRLRPSIEGEVVGAF